MKKLYVIVLLVLLKGMSYAQQKLPSRLDNDTLTYKYTPLWVIKMPDSITLKLVGNITSNMVSPDLISSINILKNTNSKYGVEGRYGVIEITYKKNIKSTAINPDNITELISKNKLGKKSKTLPIYVDSVIVIHPENAYIETDKILSVKVKKEKSTGIKFINILTTDPPKKYTNSPTSPDGKIHIMIRGIATNN
jgi:hypothetical protein